jgi:calcineurin-like phosphoesterase family protein
MGTLYFTSDLHLSHRAILQYTDRGAFLRQKYNLNPNPEFEAQQLSDLMVIHNEWVIQNINRRVGPTDHLYIVGDLAFGSKWEAAALIEKLNCHRHLVWGNHDSKLVDFYRSSGLFETVTKYADVVYSKRRLALFHSPIAEWEGGHHGVIHLHGHCHSNFDYEKAGLQNKCILDVGWDNSVKVLGYYGPFSFEQIEKYMEGRESIAHHGQVD